MKKISKPLVSIIVPVYNVEKYLKKCLNSLVNQTLKNLEIIVVNDGSTDGSKLIIDKYTKKYSSIIKVLEQENQGLSDARNNGLKLANADYIMFVDSDDYINIDAVEKMYNKIISDKLDVVICGNNVVNEDDVILSSTYPSKYQYSTDVEKTIFGNMCAWNKIYKRSILVDNKIKFRSRVWYEDLDYCYKVFTKTNKVAFLEENLYNYLLRANSIMNSAKANRNLEIIDAIDEIIKFSKDNRIYKKNYPIIEYLCIYHVYISAISRVINMEVDNNIQFDLINKFSEYTKNLFPHYKKNIYIKKMPINKKMVFNLVDLKQYWLIKLIFKIKK